MLAQPWHPDDEIVMILHLEDHELLSTEEVVKVEVELNRDSLASDERAVRKSHSHLLALAGTDKLLPFGRILFQNRAVCKVLRCTRVNEECHRLVIASHASAKDQQFV